MAAEPGVAGVDEVLVAGPCGVGVDLGKVDLVAVGDRAVRCLAFSGDATLVALGDEAGNVRFCTAQSADSVGKEIVAHPKGIADLVITMQYRLMCVPMVRATATT